MINYTFRVDSFQIDKKTENFISFGYLIAYIFMMMPEVYALQNSNSSSIKSKNIKDDDRIEILAWTGDDEKLASIEHDIIEKLQTDPNSSYYHYLLSHVYIRLFAINPARIDLLQKAYQVAEQAIQLAPQKEYGYIAIANILDIIGKNENAKMVL